MEISKAEIASAATAAQKTVPIPELRGAEVLIKALQAENVKYI
jgi:acetolactate synthase-1/2/3 large subunit